MKKTKKKKRKMKISIKTKRGTIKVLVPNNLIIKCYKGLDLDVYNEQMPDALLVLKSKDKIIYVVLEDTCRPEPKDIKRLASFKLVELTRYDKHVLIFRILHHCGVSSGSSLLVRLAMRNKIKLIECKHRNIDLSTFIEKYT